VKTIILLAVLAACGSKSAQTEEHAETLEPAKDAITKTTENGPVKATVKLWPAKPTLDDAIYLRLEIDAPPGISVEAPFQEAGDERLGRFIVRSYTRDSRRNADGGQHQEQTYTLEAPSSGKHRVPPLRLTMIDSRAGAGEIANKQQELLTDELPIDVAPVKSEAMTAELAPARGEIDADVGGTPWTKILAMISGAMVLGSGGVLAVRALRTRRAVARRRSAYEDAIAKLQQLQASGAPDEGHADAWFVELSSIVRAYIEHRYGLRAPELTTEEFLQLAAKSGSLNAEHRGVLSTFLERCDRVKFAGYRPDAEESLATLAVARSFVEDTRAREDEPGGQDADETRRAA
jgi:hypothetical protein